MLQDFGFQLLSKLGIDGMRDIREGFGRRGGNFGYWCGRNISSTVTAKTRLTRVFPLAIRTIQLAATIGHGDEQAIAFG
jgi:hypothetical protein